MRIGLNPVKIKKPPIYPPSPVTIVIVTYIPYLSGYFQHSLDVLKLTLSSIWKNTEEAFDLLVFDNGSCGEVREYLISQNVSNKIQYLILSNKNVGIPGAWNISFKAAPGKYVAFSDYDIYYFPGWLKAHLKIFENFPKVGMVTGTPIRPPIKYSSSTLEWAEEQKEAGIKRGVLQSWEEYWTHTKSLGMSEEEALESYEMGEDILINFKENEAYIGAGHFQFVAYKDVLEKVTPFPNTIAMGNERLLDQRINDLGLLRLSLNRKFVQHLGNTPSKKMIEQHNEVKIQSKHDKSMKIGVRFWQIPVIKKVLLKVYNLIFEIYYIR
jgi:glycosyltransferase involved in cell wall biosynthesis